MQCFVIFVMAWYSLNTNENKPYNANRNFKTNTVKQIL